MCGDCFVCIYLVCQCDGLELGRRNRRITVRGVAVRINNLDQVLHIFAYLRKYHNTELVYDPSDPVVEQDIFEQRDWTSF